MESLKRRKLIVDYRIYEAETFPEILQEFLDKNKYSIQILKRFFAFAGKPIDSSTLRRWLSGKYFPCFKNQLVLAGILEVPCGKVFASVHNGKEKNL